MSSSKKARANRINSRKSTGPRTPAGKAAVAQNACRHGLSGGFVILSHEDHSEFQDLLDQYRKEFAPKSAHETFLVHEMAQSRWTLARARRIEAHLLEQLAGAAAAINDPDARIAAALDAKSGSALATIQRYAASADRAYYRAHRVLSQGRSVELRNKASEAQTWLKAQIQNTPLRPAEDYFTPSPFTNPPVANPANPDQSYAGVPAATGVSDKS